MRLKPKNMKRLIEKIKNIFNKVLARFKVRKSEGMTPEKSRLQKKLWQNIFLT
jgi:hypothetical protein